MTIEANMIMILKTLTTLFIIFKIYKIITIITNRKREQREREQQEREQEERERIQRELQQQERERIQRELQHAEEVRRIMREQQRQLMYRRNKPYIDQLRIYLANLANREYTEDEWPTFWTWHCVGGNTKKLVTKAKFHSKLKAECAICFEKHKQGDTVFTECGHNYGKECWRKWMSNKIGNHSCPTCREFCPKTTTYALRGNTKNVV
jgi:hypothetical protein